MIRKAVLDFMSKDRKKNDASSENGEIKYEDITPPEESGGSVFKSSKMPEMPWKKLPVSNVRFIAAGVMVIFFILACFMRTDFFGSKWLLFRASIAFDDEKKEKLYLESSKMWESEAACKGLVKSYLKKKNYVDASVFIEKLNNNYNAGNWVRSQLGTMELETPKPSIAEGTYDTGITVIFSSDEIPDGTEIHIDASQGAEVEGNTVTISESGTCEVTVFATSILGIASKKKTYSYTIIN